MRWATLYRRPPILRGVSASQIRADHAANQARINARYGPALPSSPQLHGEADAAHHSAVISHARASGACAGGDDSQLVRPRNIRRLRSVRPPQNARITEIYFWVGMVPVKLGRSSYAHSTSNIFGACFDDVLKLLPIHVSREYDAVLLESGFPQRVLIVEVDGHFHCHRPKTRGLVRVSSS